ncbi:hypothetical protein [Anaerobium acetethylicum]|uniref:Uncharacterized protein n=1 Tax=Anaerobium acetethylicum TaxID=1619234 RepID=A0A1D3TZF0_9FIRM|nr:hypothetical protein [Anaerobium acetethylicum]SCP99945.1 hypothetical protein SAMN05421730_10757 [Anaerobium acetethylicum]
MWEIIEEYGVFVTEAIGGILFLGILESFFLGSSMSAMLQKFRLNHKFCGIKDF